MLTCLRVCLYGLKLRCEKIKEAMERYRSSIGKCRLAEVESDFSNLATWWLLSWLMVELCS